MWDFFPVGTSFINHENVFEMVEQVNQHSAWENALKMMKSANNNILVCFLHFKKEDFY